MKKLERFALNGQLASVLEAIILTQSYLRLAGAANVVSQSNIDLK